MPDIVISPDAWIAFFTLTALELVLGIDNIIFISILVDRLPLERRQLARRVGLFFAMLMRIGLLSVLSWLIGLTATLFTIFSQEISSRDLILIGGGMFLLWKSTMEINHLLGGEEAKASKAVPMGLSAVIVQIMLVDMVFSLDSIITAVGLVDRLAVMVAAVVASVALMMVFATPIGEFVGHHPTIKMLALSFLVVVGVVLIADGFHHHVPRGYIYFAMAFSVCVEMLNMRVQQRSLVNAPAAPPAPVPEDTGTESSEGESSTASGRQD